MNVRAIAVFLALGTAGELLGVENRAPPSPTGRNAWPVAVRQVEGVGQTRSWNGAGPFLFRQPDGSSTVSGFRPFWAQWHDLDGKFRSGAFLYPIFSYTTTESTYRWSVFQIVRRIDRRTDAEAPRSDFEQQAEFEVWPFWFSHRSSDPADSYRGLFPVAGTVRNLLGFARVTWVAFPFFVEIEKKGAVTTQTPWPFIRVTRGAGNGWGIWPLFNYIERPGVSHTAHYLWPLGYNSTRYPSPDDPPGTVEKRDVAALPFFAYSTGPGYTSATYAWPFFGFTDRTAPKRYHEMRYFWPFLVQGRGDDRYINRWGPFYTHSIIKGYDKQWFAWPLVRHTRWTDEGLLRTQTRFLYFVYSAHRQESIARPNQQAATLTHVWPLFSAWNDGAGRRQWQALSPLEVFFPGNPWVRAAWTPLFALARHEQQRPGESRTSLLWDGITWERQDAAGHAAFHLGPLFSIVAEGGAKRVAVGNGLFGFRRTSPDGGWRMFWLDFSPKRTTTPAPAR